MSTASKQIKSPGLLSADATMLPADSSNYFRSAYQLQFRIDTYLNKYTPATNLYPNFAGLALHLGFVEESEMFDYLKTARKPFVTALKRGMLKVHELVVASCLRGNIGAIFYLKARGGSPAIAMQYLEKSVLEIEAPPGLSKQDQDRLRKVSELWERERRRELGSKVKELKAIQS
jgi:hypothetical protein